MSGGGTGGHVYPLLVVADALKEAPEAIDILYVGHSGGLEAGIIARTSLPFRTIEAGPIRGTTPWGLAQSILRLWRGTRQSRRLLQEWQPDVVLTSGAYVSVPVAIAASSAGIPVLVYLPDLKPGLSVRLQSRFADRIAVSFDEVLRFFPAGKVWVSGYPVRSEIRSDIREAGFDLLGLNRALKTLLGFGGSRGARAVNEALTAVLPGLLADYQVIHITGELDWPWVRQVRDSLPPEQRAFYHAYPYLHGQELAAALATADLAVARAGASTLAEFPAVGLPSVLVPYPYSGPTQQPNADFMVAHGAAVCVPDAELREQLEPTVRRLLSDEALLTRMSACARDLFTPGAAQRLAAELFRLADKKEE